MQRREDAKVNRNSYENLAKHETFLVFPKIYQINMGKIF